tara:strand:- start:640 stop:780 length:141 start_codon:yes stop_codon:yes gene_type:complete
MEMLEIKVTIPDEEFENFCRICEDAEMEGELEKISMTVVKSYELKG